MVQSRGKLTGNSALGLAFGATLFLFLLLFPAGERVRHLNTVRDGDIEAVQNALRHLCWIRKGQEALNETLPELPLERRRLVLREARAQGCVEVLSPAMQASYYILEHEHGEGLERAVGFERAAVEPAFEALGSTDETLRSRGAYVLASLADRLEPGELDRAEELFARLPAGPGRRHLGLRLGLAPTPAEQADAHRELFRRIREETGLDPDSLDRRFELAEPSVVAEPVDGVLFRRGEETEEVPADADEPDEEVEEDSAPEEAAADSPGEAVKPRPERQAPREGTSTPESDDEEEEGVATPRTAASDNEASDSDSESEKPDSDSESEKPDSDPESEKPDSDSASEKPDSDSETSAEGDDE